MDLESLHSYIYYLLGIWGVLTGILLILVIYRSQLSNREDDQFYLDRRRAGNGGGATSDRIADRRIEPADCGIVVAIGIASGGARGRVDLARDSQLLVIPALPAPERPRERQRRRLATCDCGR